mmetsp:Transcript_31869/g.54375  ORF Transcript_31869/g.54375 Transcript_31869/m.54375 type:complete len:356 (-) Transcript_31869:127-1194(-)
MNNPREAISAIIEEEDEEEEEDGNEILHDNNKSSQDTTTNNKDEEGLINAWQYRKSIQDERSGLKKSSNASTVAGGNDGIYCHSYDLSKRMWDQFDDDDKNGDGGDGNDQKNMEENPLVTNTNIVDCSNTLPSSSSTPSNYQQQGIALFHKLWTHLQSTLSKHPHTVIRFFLHRLPIGPGAVAMPLLMAKIRKENLPVVVLSTIRPWRWLSSSSSSDPSSTNKLDILATLRSTTDITIALDAFSSLRSPPPPEFSLLQGILTIRKCAAFTVAHYTDSITWKRPLAERFGVKRDGRKVTVQLLHLPPEEYSRGGSSTSGVRSGGGNTADAKGHEHVHKSNAVGGCSSLGGGASLDF